MLHKTKRRIRNGPHQIVPILYLHARYAASFFVKHQPIKKPDKLLKNQKFAGLIPNYEIEGRFNLVLIFAINAFRTVLCQRKTHMHPGLS
jgi:hypothetical protein